MLGIVVAFGQGCDEKFACSTTIATCCRSTGDISASVASIDDPFPGTFKRLYTPVLYALILGFWADNEMR
ncbi:hypothetical protein CCHR01_01147 [Colletotrichum chrysophilum]|uniref:Uncharacterized protein n=1 Tax=Colletotrichum chrysophilum TaxID=1836956 RepID=A0AAD9AZN4_9PEZI|nr:hypothetical protein CCHR01_01147 [Colletotrichum chrysophilum]